VPASIYTHVNLIENSFKEWRMVLILLIVMLVPRYILPVLFNRALIMISIPTIYHPTYPTYPLISHMKALLGKCIEQSLPQGHYKRASFESFQKICAIPLLSPPNQIGYQDNNCFHMFISRYLGQPSPFCQHLAGRFFGRNATPLDVYDVYGANLSSEPLPRRGHSLRHSLVSNI